MLMAGLSIFEIDQGVRRLWTDIEDSILIEMYNKNYSLSRIADALGRDYESVMSRKIILHRKGLVVSRSLRQSWLSQVRREFIKRHYFRGVQYCVRHLGLSPKTVREYIRQLGVKKAVPVRPWTDEEFEFLRANYQVNGSVYCAEKLGRSKSAICSKAFKLGLKRRHAIYDHYRVA